MRLRQVRIPQVSHAPGVTQEHKAADAAPGGTIRLVRHACGAPGLRWFGLGPDLRPIRALRKLQILLDRHSFWASGRSLADLRRKLSGSTVVVSAWQGKRLVGFGRACSDGIFRAVLWDVVVVSDLQGRGIGRRLVEALLQDPALCRAERVYLMTTYSDRFYRQLGFRSADSQQLLVRHRRQARGG